MCLFYCAIDVFWSDVISDPYWPDCGRVAAYSAHYNMYIVDSTHHIHATTHVHGADKSMYNDGKRQGSHFVGCTQTNWWKLIGYINTTYN